MSSEPWRRDISGVRKVNVKMVYIGNTVCCKILPKFWEKIHISSCFVAFLLIVIALNAKKKKAGGKQINTKAKTKIKIILLLPIKERHFYVFDVRHCVFSCVCVVFTNWFYKNYVRIVLGIAFFILKNSWQYSHKTVVFDRREIVKPLLDKVFVSFSG